MAAKAQREAQELEEYLAAEDDDHTPGAPAVSHRACGPATVVVVMMMMMMMTTTMVMVVLVVVVMMMTLMPEGITGFSRERIVSAAPNSGARHRHPLSPRL